MRRAFTAALIHFAAAAASAYGANASSEVAAVPSDPKVLDRKLGELHSGIAAAEAQLADALTVAAADFEAWMDKLPEGPQLPSIEGELARFPFDALEKNETPDAIAGGRPAMAHKTPRLVDGRRGKAAEFDGGNGFTLPGLGHFTRSDPFTFSLWLHATMPASRAVVFHRSREMGDAGRRGYELLLEGGHAGFALHHIPPGNSLKVATKAPIEGWTHIAVTYDGSSRASGLRVFLNGREARLNVIRDGLKNDITTGAAEPDLAIGFRPGDAGFNGGRVDEFRIFDRALSPVEIATAAGLDDYTEAVQSIPDPTPAQRKALFDFYVATAHPQSLSARAELNKARDDMRKFVESNPGSSPAPSTQRPK